jgi:septin family protein
VVRTVLTEINKKIRGSKILKTGESGVGKTTFVNTLFTTGIKSDKNLSKRHAKQIEKTVEIEITKAGRVVVFKKAAIYKAVVDLLY